MNIFYCPDITGEEITLSENDSKHAVRVLRKSIGDDIIIVDGKGTWIEGRISDDHPKKCKVNIVTRKGDFEKQSFHLHMAIAPIKSMDRFEIFLEKATEIGVSEITILLTDHTIRDKVKMERVEKIVIAAMKQSLKAYLPKLNSPIKFNDFIEQEHHEQKLIAHCEDFSKKSISKAYNKGEDVLLLIGPEGDFSIKEIESAYEKGFQGISLGNTRLRNETAGIVSVHSFHMINND